MVKSIAIRRVGGAKSTLTGKMKFRFVFGGDMYSITLHILKGDDPMILSQADLDRLGSPTYERFLQSAS